MLKHIYIFVLYFVLHNSSAYGNYFDYDTHSKQTYEFVLQLKIDSARRTIAFIPSDNAMRSLLENYIDFTSVFINNSEELYHRMKSNQQERLQVIKRSNKHSPFYLYSMGEVHLQWGLLALKYKQYLTAVLHIKKAYQLLKINMSKFPDFTPNLKSIGVLNMLIGSVPDKYNWGLHLLGMKGTVEEGLGMLEKAINAKSAHRYAFDKEVDIYYTFFLIHTTQNTDKAWRYIQKNRLLKPDYLLHMYTVIYTALSAKKNDRALDYLQTLSSHHFERFPLLYYYYGLAKLQRLDTDAKMYFNRFIKFAKSKFFIKSAYQKVAWIDFIGGRLEAYNQKMNAVTEHGNETIDIDIQAQREAVSKKMPHPSLLRARLLFDGGYLNEALSVVERADTLDMSITYRTEWFYRYARIVHEMGRHTEALEMYRKAIDHGYDIPRYYAASAALQSAYIYEKTNQTDKAKMFLELCLSTPSHEYKNSLDTKAKIRLKRLQLD